MSCWKLEEAVIDRLCEALEAGSTVAEACRFAGIDPVTYRRWMARGKAAFDREDDDEENCECETYENFDDVSIEGSSDEDASDDVSWADLYARITRSRLIGERDALLRIQEAGETDWRAAAWYLERIQPEDWGAIDRETAQELNETTSGPRRKVIYIYERPSMGVDQYGRTIELSRDPNRPPGSRIEAKPPFDDINHEPVVWGPVRGASAQPLEDASDDPEGSDAPDDPGGSPQTVVPEMSDREASPPIEGTGRFLVPPPAPFRNLDRLDDGSTELDDGPGRTWLGMIRVGWIALIVGVLAICCMWVIAKRGVIGAGLGLARVSSAIGRAFGWLVRRWSSGFAALRGPCDALIRGLDVGLGRFESWMGFGPVPASIPLGSQIDPDRSWPRRE